MICWASVIDHCSLFTVHFSLFTPARWPRIIHRYLNTVPLIEGLDHTRGIELSTAVPSKIAGMVARGEADVGLASTFDAAATGVPMVLLTAGMIGCDGPTLTVRLFSETPIDRIETVHIDNDSHSSAALCRVLLGEMYGI
ncbi:MAG: hypothetical protein L6Q35_16960, partial [Phycisphaerales bacterium]|nr:hypothetical protein [Phycisphaerales bacterium]